MNIQSSQSKVKILGLVRDKNGRPKIDDGNTLPQELWDLLSAEEASNLRADPFYYKPELN
jgi:hypothetical protein